MSENGKRRTLWMSNELDAKAEQTRKILGLSRSGFYRFAIVEVIKQFAIFEKPKEAEKVGTVLPDRAASS
jgi:hypothetical protein